MGLEERKKSSKCENKKEMNMIAVTDHVWLIDCCKYDLLNSTMLSSVK